MSLITRLLVLLFFSIAVVVLAAESFDHQLAIYISKPFLMLFLMAFYTYRVKQLNSSFDTMILVALAFSLFGDVFLMLRPHTEQLFLIGLGSFLVAQICYSVAFISDTRTSILKGWKAMDLVMPLMIILYSTLFALLLIGELTGAFRIAVLVYLSSITLMCLSAAMRIRDGLTSDRLMVLTGAILFVLSDSAIAITKFFDPSIPYARFLIMFLYIAGQYLIISGCVNYRNPEASQSKWHHLIKPPVKAT
jgi:uncharacterized membrane protein YhhN